MAWIESHQSLGRHPKTKRLARLLGASLPTAVGHLHYLWWWALDFAEDGDLSRYASDEIAEEAQWAGEPDAFVSALKTARFLDEDGHLHDWEDYTGKLVEQRESNRNRQRTFRERKKAAQSNADISVTSPLGNGATVPNPTPPNRTVPNTTVVVGVASSPENPTEIQRKSAGNPTEGPRQSCVTPTPTPTVPKQQQGGGAGAVSGNGEWSGLTPIDAYEKGSAKPITQLDAEMLTSLVAQYGDQSVIDAVKTAAGGGNWRGGTTYVERILQRWEREGRDEVKPKVAVAPKKDPLAGMFDFGAALAAAKKVKDATSGS